MDFDKFLDKLDSLPIYNVELGVFTDTSARKGSAVSGVTNAELMFIHENGSPLHHIPARPVLRKTIIHVRRNWLDKELDKLLKAFVETDGDQKVIENELEKFCIRVQNYARNIIYDNNGELMENAPSVMKAKWKKEKHTKGAVWTYPEGNHPLFDTGQLARSIVCRLTKEEKTK